MPPRQLLGTRCSTSRRMGSFCLPDPSMQYPTATSRTRIEPVAMVSALVVSTKNVYVSIQRLPLVPRVRTTATIIETEKARTTVLHAGIKTQDFGHEDLQRLQ